MPPTRVVVFRRLVANDILVPKRLANLCSRLCCFVSTANTQTEAAGLLGKFFEHGRSLAIPGLIPRFCCHARDIGRSRTYTAGGGGHDDSIDLDVRFKSYA